MSNALEGLLGQANQQQAPQEFQPSPLAPKFQQAPPPLAIPDSSQPIPVPSFMQHGPPNPPFSPGNRPPDASLPNYLRNSGGLLGRSVVF